MNLKSTLRFLTVVLFAVITFSSAYAQDTRVPEMPDPIKNLAASGAQVRFLGRNQGMDGWITVKHGQEQFFYVTPDGKGIVMGILFDENGKMITSQQIQTMGSDDTAVLSMLSEDAPSSSVSNATMMAKEESLRTPSERLFADVENSNWVSFGQKDAPVIYVFADPQCPHCHAFLRSLKESYIDAGKVQVRLVPIGLREETMAQAAFLLAAPDAEDRWYRYDAGDEAAIPAKKSLNTQGVQRNLAIMQSWKFEATPLTVYRSADGSVKLMMGNAGDIKSLISDLPKK